MPNDATFELLADLQNKQKAAIAMIVAPIYNIDDKHGEDPHRSPIVETIHGAHGQTLLCKENVIWTELHFGRMRKG